MPTLDGRIDGFVAGDAMQVKRTIGAIPDTRTLTKAWFTVKESEDDDDAEALFQKEITPTDAPGTGQITDTGTGSEPDRTAKVRYDLAKADTLLLDPRREYAYDVRALLDTGDPHTGEKGVMVATAGVTDAST